MMTKLAVIYYSATGHGTTMAARVAKAAESAGADVRLRHIAETRDPATFAQNPAWTANYPATKDLPAATGDDIVWADAVIVGSPTRFGFPRRNSGRSSISFGGLWAQGTPRSPKAAVSSDDLGSSKQIADSAITRLALAERAPATLPAPGVLSPYATLPQPSVGVRALGPGRGVG